ncbi:MAG: hypothetical protein ACLTAF_03570 [Blautia coccoides]
MDTYTVLLADDEEGVIRPPEGKLMGGTGLLRHRICQQWCQGAGNGGEFQPDVVLTDIKMPYMDGMELAKRIKAELPPPKSFSSQALMSLNMQRGRPSGGGGIYSQACKLWSSSMFHPAENKAGSGNQ